MTTFKFRPHHLLCNLCFQGKGYNEEFIKNFQQIHDSLKKIKIISSCDDICAKCPEKIGEICTREDKVVTIDQAYLKLLKLKLGQTITKQILLNKIKQNITMNDFHQTCKNCSWYNANLCAPIINKIINQ